MTRALLLRVSPLRLTVTSALEAQSYLWALSHLGSAVSHIRPSCDCRHYLGDPDCFLHWDIAVDDISALYRLNMRLFLNGYRHLSN